MLLQSVVIHSHTCTGQKGSDYSAKEATRKVISGAKQLEALQSMISLVVGEANKHHVEVSKHCSSQAKQLEVL